MPRRRPPGSIPACRSAVLAFLFLLPIIAGAQQQQHPPQPNGYHIPSHQGVRVDTVLPEGGHTYNKQTQKRTRHTSTGSENERAIATLPAAPADSNPAVRAPAPRPAATNSGISPSNSRARSLGDWEVEDFVLLATVDGTIHARDRSTGKERWSLHVGHPVVETIYHQRNEMDGVFSDEVDDSPLDFLWIVEPSQDVNLFIYHPGARSSIQKLEMTVKQLAEDLAPYWSSDPPVVYTAKKENTLYTLDARSGTILKRFSASGSNVINDASCGRINEFDRQAECKGTLILGHVEYEIGIQNVVTGKPICTIKYFEWTPNLRDRDLHSQYSNTMDDNYVYSKFDGTVIARNPRKRRPMYTQKLSTPVVRVFDVARSLQDEDDPALVILPQPASPINEGDELADIWINCTETGSWYAMSEESYPYVTEDASRAPQIGRHWPQKWELVGVHSLTGQSDYSTDGTLIGGTGGLPIDPPPPDASATQSGSIVGPSKAIRENKSWGTSFIVLLTIAAVVVGFGLGSSVVDKQLIIDLIRKKLSQIRMSHTPITSAKTETEAASMSVSETVSLVDVTAQPDLQEEKYTEEKRVRFADPDDDESLTLSRSTTIDTVRDDLDSPISDGNGDTTPTTPNSDQTGETLVAPTEAVTKKKKTHRGRRGGRKKNRGEKQSDDNTNLDETTRIIEAARQLEQPNSLQPDEPTITPVTDMADTIQLGKLTIYTDRILGNGSGGTFVFEGKWKEREVAVKRMLPQYFGLAEQEVSLLQQSDLHPNVIRYFDDEKDQHFLYIAVELCQASLWDLYRDGRPEDLTDDHIRLVGELDTDVPRALYQLAAGVNHLHSLRIIHRDIKPQNILIAYPQKNQKGGPRLVISDFGLCKTLPDNVSTLVGTTGNAGTIGWKAPELILQPKEMELRQNSATCSRDSSSSTDPVAQGVKRAVDIFSLGCVFFYVLTKGQHPFDDDEGWMQIRELNIKKNNHNFSRLEFLGDDSEEPMHLISWMLSPRPEDRPTALEVMQHPFFWSAEKRLTFLCDVSDHWEREPRDPPSYHLEILESTAGDVIGPKNDFLAKLDKKFIDTLGKQRKYTGGRMLDLLRALRNKKNHYEDMDEAVKVKVGPLPHGYLRYWTTKFPKLLMECYLVVQKCNLKNEPRFKRYFEGAIMD